MGKEKSKWSSEWVAPIFIILALLAVWLALEALPSGTFGSQWSTFKDSLWTYMPWLILFAVGLYTLSYLVKRK